MVVEKENPKGVDDTHHAQSDVFTTYLPLWDIHVLSLYSFIFKVQAYFVLLLEPMKKHIYLRRTYKQIY